MTDTTPAEMREQAKQIREGLDATRVWSESDLRAGADALDRLADAIDLHRPAPIYEDADHWYVLGERDAAFAIIAEMQLTERKTNE